MRNCVKHGLSTLTLHTPDITKRPGNFDSKRFRTGIYIAGTLLLFFFALDLLVSSLHFLGEDVTQRIVAVTGNPFSGLFVGLLITALLQSSSTTTAIVVVLVASGSLTIQSAVPIVMGANVGTTITSMIVSLGFIGRKKELRRAVAAGSYHCFFNLLSVVILFPLEYYYGFLARVSLKIYELLFSGATAINNSSEPRENSLLLSGTPYIVDLFPHAVFSIVLALILLFVSILLFRKVISSLLKAGSPEAFSRFFFVNDFKSFAWGLLTTAAIRSSTITTSVVVPIVANKLASLRQAAPFIMGANIGTTVTAFFAAFVNGASGPAIIIAICHLLFNVISVLLFYPVSFLRRIPLELSQLLGRLTLRFPLVCLGFILLIFFLIPVSLILLSK